MNKRPWVKPVAVLASVAAAAIAVVLLLRHTGLGRAATWQRLASPGELSSAHAFLEDNCSACHTAVKGPEAAKCIACHVGDTALLQRQPTAFHAEIGSCRECHAEHQGVGRRPTVMDHNALAQIARRRGLSRGDLDCAACHSRKDHHFGLFGRDCAGCHGTDKWTIPAFRHPPPGSTDCAQCHQAPPSHYMGHFHMVSRKVAGKPHAQVNQCYLCHQTTSWNDIKGVGWYKHH